MEVPASPDPAVLFLRVCVCVCLCVCVCVCVCKASVGHLLGRFGAVFQAFIPTQWFSTTGGFLPQGTSGDFSRHFGCRNSVGAASSWWVEPGCCRRTSHDAQDGLHGKMSIVPRLRNPVRTYSNPLGIHRWKGRWKTDQLVNCYLYLLKGK